MRSILCAIALSACLIPFGNAQAADEDAPLHALRTGDDTKGWEAVGRLNLGSSGFCTGTLISQSLVLTAAHCLFDKTSGAAFAASDMEFLAGWRNGRAAAYRGVRRAVAHPDYIYEGPNKIDRVSYDLALIELDQPIRLPSIRPFETDRDPRDGETVGVVSYALDRSEAPSLQDACTVLGRQPGILVLSCAVDFGSSGAPVFAMRDGVAKIVSVVSAKAELNDRLVALGTAMEEPLATLMSAFEGGAPSTIARTPQLRRGAGTGSGGAKFVKP